MKYNIKISKDLEKYLIKTLQEIGTSDIGWKFNIYPDGQQEIEWFCTDGIEPPHYKDIFAKANKLKEDAEEEYYKTEYARLRKAEYDKLNQDEMRFDDLMNGTTTWQDTIIAIKAKYPKQL